MKIDIKVEEDENFKIVNNESDEIVSDTPTVQPKGKIPAPLVNPNGIGWFDGTSWGTK